MVNAQGKSRALRDALMNQNATQVAAAMQLPPIALSSASSSSSHKHRQQSMVVDDVDYGSMLSSLLDATAAAENVSAFLSNEFVAHYATSPSLKIILVVDGHREMPKPQHRLN